MSSMALNREDLQDTRVLAHKLFTQCRDSSGVYKSLNSSLRKFRNVLEEVEDAFDDGETIGSEKMIVMTKVGNGRDVLLKLDVALQHYRAANPERQVASANSVADFLRRIEVSTREVANAFESMGRIDGAEAGPSKTTPPTTQSSNVPSHSVTSSERGRIPSIVSSDWSSAVGDIRPREVGSLVPDDTGIRRAISSGANSSNRKESLSSLSRQNHTSASASPTFTPDWRSPFASLDPLSVSLEAASSIILSEDSSPSHENMRSSISSARSGSSITFADSPMIQTSILDRKPSDIPMQDTAEGSVALELSLRDQTAARSAEIIDRPLSSSLAEHQMLQSGPVDGSKSVSDGEQHTDDSPQHALPSLNYDSPASYSLADTGRLKRLEPTMSTYLRDVTMDDMAHKSSEREERVPPKSRQEYTAYVPPSLHSGSNSRYLPANEHNSNVVPELVRKQESDSLTTNDSSQIEYGDPVPPAVSKDLSDPDQFAIEQNAVAQPTTTSKPPFRRPPPPPPPPRRTTNNMIKSLPPLPRTVTHGDNPPTIEPGQNPKPSTQDRPPETPDSLYDLSNPASPAHSLPAFDLTPKPLQIRNRMSMDIPRVSVDNSACERTENDENPAPVPQTQLRVAVSPQIRQRSSSDVPRISPLARGKRPISTGRDFENAGRFLKSTTEEDRRKSEDLSSIARRFESSSSSEVNSESSRREQQLVAESILSSASERPGPTSVAPANDGAAKPDSKFHGPVEGFYAPIHNQVQTNYTSSTVEIEKERILAICDLWNKAAYAKVEQYLRGYLQDLGEKYDINLARRMKHLLGVCLSWKGQPYEASLCFLDIFNSPVLDVSELDEGDFAAAYWLGDCYAMMNKRNEALLAYSMVERSRRFQDPMQPRLQSLIKTEQQLCQFAINRDDYARHWAEQIHDNDFKPTSILDTRIISANAARICLETQPRRMQAVHTACDATKSRASSMQNLHVAATPLPSRGYCDRKITPRMFESSAFWPLPYDPFFALANVAHGRLLASETDLEQVYSTNQAKITKSGPAFLSRMDCFTHSDLMWLINTIRECLKTHEMEWSEVANDLGTWFVVRYSFIDKSIATTHYFAISIFKQSLRSGYGVEICPDGMCSSRDIRSENYIFSGFNPDYDRGVHYSEPKRIKKLFREYLDLAAKAAKGKKKYGTPSAPPKVNPPELESGYIPSELHTDRIQPPELGGRAVQVPELDDSGEIPPALPPRPSSFLMKRLSFVRSD